MAFLDGTQPHNTCTHMGDGTGLMDSLFGANSDTAGTSVTGGGINNGQQQPAPGPDGQPAQHRNFFQKMFGIGKHNDDGSQAAPQQAPSTVPPPQPVIIPR